MIPETSELRKIFLANEATAFQEMAAKHKIWATRIETHNSSLTTWFNSIQSTHKGDFFLDPVKVTLDEPIRFRNPMETARTTFKNIPLQTSQRKMASSLVRYELKATEYPHIPLTWIRRFNRIPRLNTGFVLLTNEDGYNRETYQPAKLLTWIKKINTFLLAQEEMADTIESLRPLAFKYFTKRYPNAFVTFTIEPVDMELSKTHRRPLMKLFAYLHFYHEQGVKVCIDPGPLEGIAMSRLELLHINKHLTEICSDVLDSVNRYYYPPSGGKGRFGG